MVNCQADDPGAGIFRPVCDTLQNEGDSNSPPKMMTRVLWSRTDVVSDIHRVRPASSSFNRLSIAYLRLNLLEADCSARERYLRHFARMEKAPRLGRPLRLRVRAGNAHSRE